MYAKRLEEAGTKSHFRILRIPVIHRRLNYFTIFICADDG